MKKISSTSIAGVLACILFTLPATAQSIQHIKTHNQQVAANTPPTYTYQLFQAPNKMYGYDIFFGKKIVFHQGASPALSSEFIAALSTKQQADAAALLSINKLKKKSINFSKNL